MDVRGDILGPLHITTTRTLIIKIKSVQRSGTEAIRIQIQANFRPFSIRKTCPCDLYPLTPHFYIVKLGYRGIHFFLFLLLNIDCGYSLEPPQ